MADRVLLAIDLNPFHWVGSAAKAAAADAWQVAMTGLWSAGLWLQHTAFTVVDTLLTPDLTVPGPLGAVLPTTLWISAAVAGLMMTLQMAAALARRDGQSLARICLGVAQFGVVWVAYLGVAGGLVEAAAGLTRGIMAATLNTTTLSGVDLSSSWPKDVADLTQATVLGVLSLLLVIPAAFAYLLVMLVRETALIVLVATAPVAAGGLLSDTGRVWFWKTLRWFLACLLISPMAALLLGVGVKVSQGVIAAPGQSSAAQQTGMAVVGSVVIAVSAVSPLVLFRLLAFVDPGTASGAALRQSWSDTGGMTGLLSTPGGGPAAGRAATAAAPDGRSAGEAGAEAQTQSRLASTLGAAGTAIGMLSSAAHRAVDIGSDVLGQAGVGSPGYSLTPADQSAGRRVQADRSQATGPGDSDAGTGGDAGDGGGGRDGGGGSDGGGGRDGGGGAGGTGDAPTPHMSPPPGPSTTGPSTTGPSVPGPSVPGPAGGAGAGGAAAGHGAAGGSGSAAGGGAAAAGAAL